MNKTKAVAQYRNNYITQVYFSPPRHSIQKKIDLITLSTIDPDEKQSIDDLLVQNGFRAISDQKMTRGNFAMKRTYESKSDDAKVEILHSPKSSFRGRPTLILTIHDPHESLLELFHSFFRSRDIHPKVSQMELAFDFFTSTVRDLWNLKDFLESHLFLKYQRTNSFWYKTTYYLNKGRRSSKGQKIYVKQLENTGEQFVRVELTLRRRSISSLELEFPPAVEAIPLSRFFEFRRFNEEHLRDHLIWRRRDLIAQIEQRRPGYGSLLVSQTHSWVNCISQTEHGDLKPLMEINQALKSAKDYLPNYSRFLKPFEQFNREFSDRVANQRFLSTKRRGMSH
jgi:hypothetical protein